MSFTTASKKQISTERKKLILLTRKLSSFPLSHKVKKKVIICRKTNFPEQNILKKQLRRLVLDQYR